MLKKLFISKVRVSILSIYMTNLTTSYHVRGLVRLLNEEINAVRRELLNLESAGILKSKKVGNKLVYKINMECPILWELRSIFYKESEIGEAIIKTITEVEEIDVAVLTNSFITKEYLTSTDVDILFIGSMKLRELSSVMSKVEQELGRDIRYSAITKEDFEFARKKREPFLMNILENDKIVIHGQISDLL